MFNVPVLQKLARMQSSATGGRTDTMGSNYSNIVMIILGCDNKLQFVVRQTYNKVKVSQVRFL